MARVALHIPSGEVSLVAATAKTVLQIVAAANHRVILQALGIYFKGTVSTDQPAKCRILRQSTAGTMTAATPVKNNDGDDETLQTTGQYNASAEPTAGDVLDVFEIHPQAGLLQYFPLGQEIVIKGGGRLGIEITAPQAQTVAVKATCEE